MYKISLSPHKKSIRFIILIIALTITIPLLLWFFLLFSRPADNLHGAQSIQSTNFKIYQDKVYVSISGGGYYLVVDADPNSITPIEPNSLISRLAKDNNHVFCGNKAIPLLNPNNITVSFDGYIADDNSAYYCDTAKPNPNVSVFEKIIGLYKTAFDYDKTQTYYNELVKLENSSPQKLVSIMNYYAKDDNTVYYKGRKMENADPNTIKNITEITPGLSEKKSYYYLQDKNHLYYRGEMLPNATPENTKIYTLQDSELLYAYDSKIDQFYIGSFPFPDFVDSNSSINNKIRITLENKNQIKQLPNQYTTDHLQFLNTTNKHTNHELFFNDEGIFYWNSREKQLMLACPTPFNAKNVSILGDGFLADGQNSYFLQATDKWGNGKYKGIISSQTQIIRINDVTSKHWQKWANVRNKSTYPKGTIWKANEDYYFEAYASKENGFKSTLYKIKNINDLLPENLESAKYEDSYILKVEDKELPNYLSQIAGELVCESVTHYR